MKLLFLSTVAVNVLRVVKNFDSKNKKSSQVKKFGKKEKGEKIMTKIKKAFAVVTAFILTAVCGVGIVTKGFKDFGGKPKIENQIYNGMITEGADGKGMQLRTVCTSSGGENTSVTVTATLTTDGELYDETLSWGIAFDTTGDTAYSEWATGKACTDYVQMTVAADTKSVTVKCLEAFGAPIKLTATSNQNEDCTATCQFDYIKRVQALENFKNNGSTFETLECGVENVITCDVVWNVGTYMGDTYYTRGNVTLEDCEDLGYVLYNDLLGVQVDQDNSFFSGNMQPLVSFSEDNSSLEFRMYVNLSCMVLYDEYHSGIPDDLTATQEKIFSDYLYQHDEEYSVSFEIQLDFDFGNNLTEQAFFSAGQVRLSTDKLPEPAAVTVALSESKVYF